MKDVFSEGGKVFDGIKEGISGTFTTVVNGLIDGINRVISVPFKAINTALRKIRDITIAGIQPFKDRISEISIPEIPRLAGGGIVDKKTIAMIGERGREAVIPLKNNTEWLDMVADRVASRMQAGSVVNNFNQTIYSPKAVSRADIYRQSKNLLDLKGG